VNHPDAGLRARTKRPRDLYDVEVQYADRQVGHFIDHLRVKPKLWPNTVVIVTADHGEEFGEHGGRFHDRTCYRESTHVPLIVRVPGLSPAVAPSRVGLTDLAPTILSLVGAPADPSLPGRNLLFSDPARYAQVPDARVSCLYFPDATPTSGLMHAVREDRWLYVRNVSRGTDEVYDTVLDPAEKRNLADDPIGRSVAERLAHAVRPPRIEARDRPTALPVKRPPKGTSATPPPR
jgi:arylsulfatase A-like enzyme